MKISERAGETHFRKNGFARRLVLTQRQTRTRKWAISQSRVLLNSVGATRYGGRCEEKKGVEIKLQMNAKPVKHGRLPGPG